MSVCLHPVLYIYPNIPHINWILGEHNFSCHWKLGFHKVSNKPYSSSSKDKVDRYIAPYFRAKPRRQCELKCETNKHVNAQFNCINCSACVAAVKGRPVLHPCVVIFFWSSGIMGYTSTCMLFTFQNGVPLMR